jgi:dTDP-4-amino-4,6-dideoxygalactose transaminase
LANAALGIGAGDEVIVPSLTFVATANAIKYTGATPVFVDITSEDDLGISPAAIEAAITPATKAITVMHYGGYLCDMDAINAIARKHNLAVIEDAAHAPGTELNDKKAGAFSDAACFSFFSNKNLVTGEGGMIVTDRDDLAERIKLMRSHGMTTLTWDRHKGHAHSYDVVTLGYNYRIDEIRSALGLTQLSKLPKNNERRREITNWYRAQLSEVDELAIPYLQHPGLSAAHLFPILLDSKIDRTAFIDQMKQRGIQTSIHYPPIHQFTYYRQQNGTNHRSLPLTESVGRREVTLPLYPTMSADDVKQVVAAIKDSISSVH